MVQEPGSILSDIPGPLPNNRVLVIRDETHFGDSWWWFMADYNGDGVYNWVPLAPNNIIARDFFVRPITSNELETDAVTTIKILDANVTANKLATDSVTTTKIADTNITSGKLATDSVTTAKIVNGNVTVDKLATDSVITAKIVNGNVVTSKIADANVTKAKLAFSV
jgi:hypothetical protein